MNYKEFIDEILKTRGRFNCGEEYCERHHIVPKCLGGTDEKDNLIDLFAREHFVSHKLLALENPDNKGLQYAWWMMAHGVVNEEQDRYECTQLEYEEARKNIHEKCSGINAYWYGKTFSLETKHKMSEARKNFVFSEGTRKKISESKQGEKHPMYGKHHTEEARRKMSEKRKGCIPWNTGVPANEETKELLLFYAKMPKNQEHRNKISESNKGKAKSKEHREKISIAKKGKYTKSESPHAKKIFCDGIIFGSIVECAEYYGLKSSSNIGAFLNGKKKMPQKWIDRKLSFYEDDKMEEGDAI